MNISCAAPEARLCEVFAQVVEAGATTPDALVASPELCLSVKRAMRDWFVGEAGRREASRQALASVGVDMDMLASEALKTVFRPWGYKNRPYPSLTALLEQVCTQGPESAVPFLDKVLKWKVIGLLEAYPRRKEMLLVADRLTGRDPSSGPVLRDLWAEDACDRYTVGAVLTGLGRSRKSFIADLAFLADALGEERATVADALIRGDQKKYADGLVDMMKGLFGWRISGLLEPLLAQAEGFELPSELREDHSALQACLAQQHGAAVRARLAGARGGGN